MGDAGVHLNSISAFVFAAVKQTSYVGAKGTVIAPGIDFDEHPDLTFSVPVAKITKIYIYALITTQ